MKLPKDYIFYKFNAVKSTNDTAKELLKENCIAVLAEEQTHGRGKNKSEWVSQKENLYLSIAFKGGGDAYNAFKYIFLTAIVLGNVLSDYDYYYKWPNDIFLDDKKVAGILTESDGDDIIIGIGVNLKTSPLEHSTCLAKYADYNAEKITENIVNKFDEYKDKYKDFSEIKRIWEERAYLLNQKIDLDKNGEILTGKFIGINNEGALMLKNLQGGIENLYSGSICI